MEYLFLYISFLIFFFFEIVEIIYCLSLELKYVFFRKFFFFDLLIIESSKVELERICILVLNKLILKYIWMILINIL